MLVAKTSVELDEVLCLLGCVHGQLLESMFPRPVLTGLEQCTTDSLALDLGIYRELMHCGNSRPCEVLALVLAVGRLDNDRARKFAFHFDHVALTSFDSLGSDFYTLVYSRVVQSHGAKARICAMEQLREFVQGVAWLEGSDGMHGTGVTVTPNVRAKLAPAAWRAGQQAQNGAKPQRLMARVSRRWGSA